MIYLLDSNVWNFFPAGREVPNDRSERRHSNLLDRGR